MKQTLWWLITFKTWLTLSDTLLLCLALMDLQRFWETLLSRTFNSFTFFFCATFFASPPSCSILAVETEKDEQRALLEMAYSFICRADLTHFNSFLRMPSSSCTVSQQCWDSCTEGLRLHCSGMGEESGLLPYAIDAVRVSSASLHKYAHFEIN